LLSSAVGAASLVSSFSPSSDDPSLSLLSIEVYQYNKQIKQVK
jgi:hypothetical protein